MIHSFIIDRIYRRRLGYFEWWSYSLGFSSAISPSDDGVAASFLAKLWWKEVRWMRIICGRVVSRGRPWRIARWRPIADGMMTAADNTDYSCWNWGCYALTKRNPRRLWMMRSWMSRFVGAFACSPRLSSIHRPNLSCYCLFLRPQSPSPIALKAPLLPSLRSHRLHCHNNLPSH